MERSHYVKGGVSGVRVTLVALLTSVLMLSPIAIGPSQGASTPLITWRHGMLNAKGDAAFSALFALEKGFYRKHGLDVKITQFDGSLHITQALVAGQLDTAENNADPVIRAVAKGADLVAIGSTISGIAYTLYTKKEITTFEQLRGKTVGVSAPGAFPDLITRAMLLEKGVDPNSVTLVSAGDDATRYKALVAGKVDAVAASPEFEPQAKRDGVTVLGEASKLLPNFPRFLIWANPRTLKERPDGAVAFLAGTIEGLRYALSHRSEAIKWTALTLNVPPDSPRIVYTYDVQAPLVSRNAALPRQKVAYVANFLRKIGDIEKVPNLDTMINVTFLERAWKEIGP